MEIQISQDIRKFKTKDVGNFSFKQAGFIAAAAAIGFVVYKFSNSFELAIPPAAIVLVLGFFRPYGMSAIQFFRTVVKEKLTTQCYINETDFEYNFDEFKQLYGDDVIIPTDVVIQTAPVKINKEDAERIIR